MDHPADRQTRLEPFQKCVMRLVRRGPAHSLQSWTMIVGSADADLGVGDELIWRHRKVGRRRPLPDAAGGVGLRAMARAEPAVVVALMGKRDAAEVGADADNDEPLIVALFYTRRVRLRIGQGLRIDLLRFVHFFLAAMADEDRLGTPEYLDD